MSKYIDYKSKDDIHQLNDYIALKKPVLFSSIRAISKAREKWSPEYITSIKPHLPITVKQYGSSRTINTKELTLKEYLNHLISHRIINNARKEEILYCHDIPLLSLLEELIEDIEPSFLESLPKWYHEKWWLYVQFFMGPAGSWTPLHFDCLMTHNIFFQVKGSKRFTLIKPEDGILCGRYNWRWFELNPEKPDYDKFPNLHQIKMHKVVINAGDMLYIPPGTLHAVRGLEESISFNIDFHTSSSVLASIPRIFQGMPLTNVYYNIITLLGVVFKIPSRYLFPFYKSYLNYIS